MHLKKLYSIILLFFLFGYQMLSQVGININPGDDPKTTLDVNGAISLKSSALTLGTGNNVNIPVGDFSLFNISGPTYSFNINSIEPISGTDGQIVTFVNSTVHNMIILHDSGASVNSIYCPNGIDLVLTGEYSTVTMQYNRTQDRWIVLKYVDKETYGDTIYNSVGTSDTQTSSNSFIDIEDMSYIFTPKNSVVYLNVSVSGKMDGGGNTHGYADLILVNETAGNSIIAGATALSSDNNYNSVTIPWNIRMGMVPVIVNPGVPTKIKVQWRCGGILPPTLYCLAATDNLFSHRNITIVD